MSIGELKEENKKLKEEIERLKIKNDMLEMINFYLIRKDFNNEKNNIRC